MLMNEQLIPDDKQALETERRELLEQVENWLEVPMLILGFVWLILLGIELLWERVWEQNHIFNTLSTIIWIIFIINFVVELILAPHKLNYFKRNWLTALSLIVPALRVFRIFRVIRVSRAARAVRGIRLVKVVGSLNRGMRALGASMGRRGVGYVVALTVILTLSGAAGMYAFENENPAGLNSYGEALWWTAMIMTTMGSAYWPQSPEGRVLCVTLALTQEKELAKVLGVPDNITLAVMLPTAYYTGKDFKPAKRLPARERTHWNTWGTRR